MNLSSNFMSCINITFNKLSFSLYFTFKTLSSNKSNYKKYLNGSFIVWYLLFCLINAYNIPIKNFVTLDLCFGMKYSWEGQSRCQNRCNLWVTRWSWMLDPIKQSFRYWVTTNIELNLFPNYLFYNSNYQCLWFPFLVL